MESSKSIPWAAWSLLMAGVLPGADAPPAHDLDALARKTQDPTAELISIPFQSNWYVDVGPYERTQYVLNIQPVIPVPLNDEWKLLTRTIAPIIDAPIGRDDRETGLGDLNATAWLSPEGRHAVTWGLGAVAQLPTATESALGTGRWAVGPSGVAVYKAGPWVIGGLANHLWDVAGWTGNEVDLTTIQPFINYNLPKAWSLGLAPTITGDWTRDGDDVWTVPLGLSLSKVGHVGRLPLKASIAAYDNVVRPEYAADWQLQFAIVLILPE